MKILFDYQMFLSQRYGGPSRYFIELNKNFKKLGISSLIYSPFYINNYLKSHNPVNSKKYFFLKRKFKLNNLYKFLNTKFTLNKLKKDKINLLHPTYYDILMYKDIKIPKILTVYDLTHEKFPEYYGLKKNHKIKQEALNLSDYFLCPSKSAKNDLMEIYNIPSNKISVVYWAPFLKKNEFFEKIEGKPFLLYVGNRHKYKNAYTFLKAFSINKYLKKQFRIIFFGGGHLKKFEKDIISNLGLNDLVESCQGTDNDLINLYKNARALVYPSKYEGLGLPILEAMKNNCPVITSYSSGMIEAGGNAVEYFNPNDHESIKESILKVIDSESYRQKLIDLGIEHVGKFNWTSCTKQTFEIYKKLV